MQDNSGAPVAATLRTIAAWLESHPEIVPYEVAVHPLTFDGKPIEVAVYGLDAAGIAAAIRSIGGRWDKKAEGVLFEARYQIAPDAVLALHAARENVCTRVVTGTMTVTEPDPEALAAVPKITREVETYEWRCDPLLAPDEAAA
jgi:hypothetical protein